MEKITFAHKQFGDQLNDGPNEKDEEDIHMKNISRILSKATEIVRIVTGREKEFLANLFPSRMQIPMARRMMERQSAQMMKYRRARM